MTDISAWVRVSLDTLLPLHPLACQTWSATAGQILTIFATTVLVRLKMLLRWAIESIAVALKRGGREKASRSVVVVVV